MSQMPKKSRHNKYGVYRYKTAMMSRGRIYKRLHPLLRMWTMQKPLNNSIFLQGHGTSWKQICFCLCWWWVKKISFKKITAVCITCNTLVFKDWVFKWEKYISELLSGRVPIEVTPEPCMSISYIIMLPIWGAILWTPPQSLGSAMWWCSCEPRGTRLTGFGAMSPDCQCPASFSPTPTSPRAGEDCAKPLPSNLAVLSRAPVLSLAGTSHPLRSLLYRGPFCCLVSRGERERNAGPHSQPGPSCALWKLIGLMSSVCQAVIQARGDLDGDEASIVKMTLWSTLWSSPWTPWYSKGRKPHFLQKQLDLNGKTHYIRDQWIFSLDLCLKHKSGGETSQLSTALCEHIHAFKLLISLLTDVIVKYVLFAFKMRDWTDGKRSV